MKLIPLRLKHLRPLAILVFFVFTTSLPAQNVKTYVTSDSLSVGDVFNYSLVLQLNQEYDRVVFPDTSSFPTSIEITDRQQFKVSNFTDSLSYRLQFFSTNDVELPPLPVKLFLNGDSTVVFTDPAVLKFKSVIPDKEEAEFKPLKDIFPFPRLLWPWIVAALLLAAFLIWWFFLRKQPEPEEPKTKPVVEPFYNPLVELERTLTELKEETDVAQTRDFKTFYSEISDAIRTYYEELYKIPALESTSRELLRYLDAYGVDQEMIDHTRKVLHAADMVKFAKYTPTLDDAWDTYQHAIDFLDRAKLNDVSRIERLKAEYDKQFGQPEEPENNEGGQ